MPKGLVIECPVCEFQRPFDIDVENPPKLLEPRLKTSAKEHLKQAHGQDSLGPFQWNKIVETMFEAEIPQKILDQIEEGNQGPNWGDYNLRPEE